MLPMLGHFHPLGNATAGSAFSAGKGRDTDVSGTCQGPRGVKGSGQHPNLIAEVKLSICMSHY